VGCDFWYSGTLPDVGKQETVIKFVETYYTDIALFVTPQPRQTYTTVLEGYHGDNQQQWAAAYPFDFYGIIPHAGSGIHEHGQFVFDRTAGGRLVRLMELPDSFGLRHREDPPEASFADEPEARAEVRVLEGGYNRTLTKNAFVFALLLNVVRHRWWPGLDVGDDYNCYRDVGRMISAFGLSSRLRDEALDFDACWQLFSEEYDAHYPPSPPPPPRPVVRVVDLDILRRSVETLELSVRTSHCLAARKVVTIANVVRMSEAELLAIPNMGRKSINEIKDRLDGLGLVLRTP